MILFPFQTLLSSLLVVSEIIATINIAPSALIRKGIVMIIFPLQELLMLFPFQDLLLPFQIVSESITTIYIMPSTLIRYLTFITLMENTMPRAFSTTRLRHRSNHRYINTMSIGRVNQGTIPFTSMATPGQYVCRIP